MGACVICVCLSICVFTHRERGLHVFNRGWVLGGVFEGGRSGPPSTRADPCSAAVCLSVPSQTTQTPDNGSDVRLGNTTLPLPLRSSTSSFPLFSLLCCVWWLVRCCSLTLHRGLPVLSPSRPLSKNITCNVLNSLFSNWIFCLSGNVLHCLGLFKMTIL